MLSVFVLLSIAGAAVQAECPGARPAPYVLSFPEAGLDDPAAYEGYRTRFFRDASGNTFQIYLKESEGRVVNLWANAANESVGFSARDGSDKPAPLAWVSDSTCVSASGSDRTMEYRLSAAGSELAIGHFVLGSMRVERDVQYSRAHLQPFGPPSVTRELREMVNQLARLPATERSRHLAVLKAGSVAELEARLQPTVRLMTEGTRRVARIEQPSFDLRNHLRLELSVPAEDTQLMLDGHTLRVRAKTGRPLILTVRVTTDATPLTPLRRAEIFNSAFLAFHD